MKLENGNLISGFVLHSPQYEVCQQTVLARLMDKEWDKPWDLRLEKGKVIKYMCFDNNVLGMKAPPSKTVKTAATSSCTGSLK